MKKAGIIIWVLFVFSILWFAVLAGKGFIVYAEETESDKIRVQVKATVPEDFVEPVSIKYEGKNIEGNEVDIILDYEHDYMAIITIPRDLYTLKHNSTAQGYTADCATAFTTEDGDADHTYWLPVTVNTDSHSETEDDGSLNLLVKADFETEKFDGSEIRVKYSGTHGNLIVAHLNVENGYQAVVQLMKDIYTKEEVQVSDGFHTIAQYSFDLSHAEAENYRLDIMVREGSGETGEEGIEQVLLPGDTDDSLEEVKETEESSNEQEVGKQKLMFEISNFEQVHLDGTVYLAYAGENNVIEIELDESGHYSRTVTEPYDIYELLYITCYDNESLIFEPSYEVINANGDEVMIPVRIFVKEDISDTSIMNILLIAAFLIAVIIIYLFWRKKMHGKKNKDSDQEDNGFDASLYQDDDYDMELNLDDE